VVLPARNEAAGIERAIETVGGVLDQCCPRWEIVIVDDGSSDDTFRILQDVSRRDPRIRGLRFSRNFGKESAILAGLRAARGQVVITMDADLQHPPEVIPALLEKWRNGAMVVNAVKGDRHTDGWLTRFRAKCFNSMMSAFGGINLEDASDFKLLDKRVVSTVVADLPERERFYRGLTDWVGFPSETVSFEVSTRVDGEGKWSLWRLIELALTAIVSFTSAPLRIVTILGMATLVIGFFIGMEALISWIGGNAVSGFATIIITLLLIGSFVMISLGIIGEYIAKIYEEVKNRPAYIVEASTDQEE
jgi:glycosyltransferase involved in cell wall biosynthesis